MRSSIKAILVVIGMLGVSLSNAESVSVDSTFEKGVLDNGLTYYVKQNTTPINTIEFRLIFKAGSILETVPQCGLAHFCEHMAFNGTEHFERNAVIKYLESVGVGFGSNLNASTSFDRTMYQFSLPYKDEGGLDSAFMIFSDWVKGLSFNPKDIEAERGVIMSEWRTDQGQKNRFKQLVMPKLYYNSRYAIRMPIGDTAVIQHFEYHEISDFYKAWYRTDLTAVVVSGDIDKELALAKINQWFGDIPRLENAQERKYYSIPVQDSTFVIKFADPEETTTSLSLIQKINKKREYDDADIRNELINEIFTDIINTRLSEISKKSDAPFMLAKLSTPNRLSHDMFIKSISITPVEQNYYQALTSVKKELCRIAKYGALADELAREKEDIIKRQERAVKGYGKRKSSSFASQYIANYLFGMPIKDAQTVLDDYNRLLPSITNDDIKEVVNSWYKTDNRIVLVETPQKYEAQLPQDDSLLYCFDSISYDNVEPYVEEDFSKPFFTDKLHQVKIVNSSYDADYNLTEWDLDNGVKILLKPTDYAKDNIQFRAFSPGGYSLLGEDDFFTASKMHAYLQGAGYGDFSKSDLNKKFNGKSAKVIAAVNEYDEGLVGNSDHESMELMLQYIYMQFVHPGEDSLAFNRFKNRLLTTYKDANLKPDYVFEDKVVRTLYQNHPRKYVIPNMDWVNNMTMNQVNRIVADRFADASDFTFVFVGDFETDSIKEMVTSYLGNLPNIGRKESPKDMKYKPLESSETFKFDLGSAPNVAKVTMRFNGKATGDNFEKAVLDAASSVLTMRILASLREKEGDIYSAAAKGGVATIPVKRSVGAISFTCSPDKVDKLVRMTKEIIDTLAMEGPTEKELVNVKTIQLEKYKKYRESNLYWVRTIKTYLENGWDISEIDNQGDFIKDINAKQVKKAVKCYYKDPVTFVLMPENK